MKKTLSDFDYQCYQIIDFVNYQQYAFLNDIIEHFGKDYTNALKECLRKQYIVSIEGNNNKVIFGLQAWLEEKFIFD